MESKDFATILFRLRNVKEDDITGPNGNIMEGRMHEALGYAVDDIKECANACDLWDTKLVLTKVFVALPWESKLAEFTSRFAQRRIQFDFILQTHIAITVDSVKNVVSELNDKYVSYD